MASWAAREPAAAVDHGVVASVDVPVVRCGVQGASQADGVAILVDPLDEARPFAKERFVRHFDDGFAGDRVGVGHEEPVGEVAVDDVGVDAGEFVAGGASAQIVVVVAGGDELGEQSTDLVAVASGGLVVELLGAAGDGAADAAECVVGVGGDDAVDALFEQFGERELQQGQCAGSGDDVADHGADEAGFEADAGSFRGECDRVVELIGGHRGDREGAVAHDGSEDGVLQRPVVEIGAQRCDDADVVAAGQGGRDGCCEPVPDGVGGDEGPEFLELVDDDHERAVGGGDVGGDVTETVGFEQTGADVADLGGGDASQCGFEFDERVDAGHHRHHQRVTMPPGGHGAGVHQGTLARTPMGRPRARTDRSRHVRRARRRVRSARRTRRHRLHGTPATPCTG